MPNILDQIESARQSVPKGILPEKTDFPNQEIGGKIDGGEYYGEGAGTKIDYGEPLLPERSEKVGDVLSAFEQARVKELGPLDKEYWKRLPVQVASELGEGIAGGIRGIIPLREMLEGDFMRRQWRNLGISELVKSGAEKIGIENEALLTARGLLTRWADAAQSVSGMPLGVMARVSGIGTPRVELSEEEEENFETAVNALAEMSKKPFPEQLEGSSGIIEAAAGGLASFAPVMAMSAANPAAGLIGAWMTIGGMTYDDLIEQGIEEDRATDASIIVAGMTAPVEFIGNVFQIKYLTNMLRTLALKKTGKRLSETAAKKTASNISKKMDLARNKIDLAIRGGKRIAIPAGIESTEEAVQALLEPIGYTYAANPEMSWSEVIEDVIENAPEHLNNAIESGKVGAVASLMLAGGPATIATGADISRYRRAKRTGVLDVIKSETEEGVSEVLKQAGEVRDKADAQMIYEASVRSLAAIQAQQASPVIPEAPQTPLTTDPETVIPTVPAEPDVGVEAPAPTIEAPAPTIEAAPEPERPTELAPEEGPVVAEEAEAAKKRLEEYTRGELESEEGAREQMIDVMLAEGMSRKMAEAMADQAIASRQKVRADMAKKAEETKGPKPKEKISPPGKRNFFEFPDGTRIFGATSGEIYEKATREQKKIMEEGGAREGFVDERGRRKYIEYRRVTEGPRDVEPGVENEIKARAVRRRVVNLWKERGVDLDAPDVDFRIVEPSRGGKIAGEIINSLFGFENVFFFESDHESVNLVNGQLIRSDMRDPDKAFILLNNRLENPTLQVAGHEMGHHLEDVMPNEFKVLKDLVWKFKNVNEWRSFYKAKVHAYKKLYRKKKGLSEDARVSNKAVIREFEALKKSGAISEFTNEFIGKQLLDERFYRKVLHENPSLYEKLIEKAMEFLRTLLNSIRISSKKFKFEYVENVEVIQDALASLVRQYNQYRTDQATTEYPEFFETVDAIYSNLEALKPEDDIMDDALSMDLEADGLPIAAAGNPAVLKSIKKRGWEVDFDQTEFGIVNNRMAKELEMFEHLFGPSSLARILPGKYKGTKQLKYRSITPYDLMAELQRVIKSGEAAELFDKNKSIKDLADRRGLRGKKRESFISEVEYLRKGKLFDIDSKAQTLGDNGKAGMSADFLLATCHPTTPCKECYAARRMIRYSTVQKAFRSTLQILMDPKGWAQSVADEVMWETPAKKKRRSKSELPFVRMLGSGDLITDAQIRGMNELAKLIDRPIHIFSRHHDMLKKLKSRPGAPFIKMGSIDSDLYDFYGDKKLSDNLKKNGIANAWLLTSEEDIPKIESLYKKDGVQLILAANKKLHDALPPHLRKVGCPCDADERTYFFSCKQCALSESGCFMAFTEWAIDKNGKFWKISDRKAPTNLMPLTMFLENPGDRRTGFFEVFVGRLRKSIDLIKYSMKEFSKGNKNQIAMKNIHYPDDIQYTKDPDIALSYIDNLENMIKDAEYMQTFFIPGGEIQVPIEYREGEKVDISNEILPAEEVRAGKSKPALKTYTGSKVARYKGDVGKLVGEKLYVHKKYAGEVIPGYQRAVDILGDKYPEFKYNTVMHDRKTGAIRFDEAPDFDVAREPRVGNYITVFKDGKTRRGKSNAIWHHKWLWVRDDYNGFNVEESYVWSDQWLNEFKEVAKGTKKAWDAQLLRYGLNTESVAENVQTDGVPVSISDQATSNFLSSEYGWRPEYQARTQIPSTSPTYKKIAGYAKSLEIPGKKILDWSSGLGHGSKILKSSSFEPFYDPKVKGAVKSPEFENIESVPSGEFDMVVNLSSVNVMPVDERVKNVRGIANALSDKGIGIIFARSREFMKRTKTVLWKNESTGEILNKAKMTYQKGYNQKELEFEIQSILGSGFEVTGGSFLKLGNPTVIIRRRGESEGAVHDDINIDTNSTVEMYQSELENYIESNKFPESGNGKMLAGLLESLAKKGTFKQEELEWTEVTDWLREQNEKVRKSKIIEYLQASNLRISEFRKGSQDHEARRKEIAETLRGDAEFIIKYRLNEDQQDVFYDELSEYIYNGVPGPTMSSMVQEEFDMPWHAYERHVVESIREDAVVGDMVTEETQYDEYVSGVGDNYKELLFIMRNRNRERNRPGAEEAVRIINEINADLAAASPHVDYVEWDVDSLKLSMVKVKRDEIEKKYSEKKYKEIYENVRNWLFPEAGGWTEFEHDHWKQHPNVLAHARFSERLEENILIIEEMQSDWHQTGRKRGYTKEKQRDEINKKFLELQKKKDVILDMRSELGSWYGRFEFNDPAAGVRVAERLATKAKEMPEEFWEAIGIHDIPTRQAIVGDRGRFFDYIDKKTNEITQDQAALQDQHTDTSVPDAPLKGNKWVEFVLRRMVREAAMKKFENIAWATGDTQKSVYPSLYEKVDEINWVKTTWPKSGDVVYHISAKKSGGGVLNKANLDAVDVEELLGKDLSSKIIGAPKKSSGTIKIDKDFRIGGEGMNVFYDKVVRNLYAKIFDKKKFGKSKPQIREIGGKTFWVAPITPEMKSLADEPVVYFDINTEIPQDAKEVVEQKIGRTDRPMSEKVRSGWDNFRKNWPRMIADRFAPIADYFGEDTVYMLHRGVPGAPTSIMSLLTHGKLRWDSRKEILTTDTIDKGFANWVKGLGKDGEKFFYWLIVKRAETLEKEGREKLLDKTARDKIMFWVGDPAGPRTWEQINEEFQDFNNSVLDIAEDAGLLNSEERQIWQSEFYIPFYRVFEDEETMTEFVKGPSKGSKFLSSQIKRLKGSEKKIGDPFENIIKNWGHLIVESVKNNARMKAFNYARDNNLKSGIVDYDENGNEVEKPLVEEVGWSDTVTFRNPKDSKLIFVNQKTGEPVLGFKDKGKTRFFRVNDPELYSAMSFISGMGKDNLFMEILRYPKRWLTHGATFGFAFRAKNFLRDTLHTFMISDNFIPLIDSMRGLVKIFRNDPEYVKYVASGHAFTGSYIRADDPKQAGKYLKDLTKQTVRGKTWRVMTKPLQIWDMIGEAMENAARVQLYSNLRLKGKTELEAAFTARDLMDFQMSGASDTILFFTSVVPFLNARIQGLYRMGRAGKQNPKSFLGKGFLIAAASIALWALFSDDDRYKELEDWEKWQYYNFWIGDWHFRIPKPFETGALCSTIWEAAANVAKGNEDWFYMLKTLGHTVLDTFSFNPVPQGIMPIAEQIFNRSMFTWRPIEGKHLQNRVLGERAEPWTSYTFQAMGKALGLPPKRTEALMRGYFSTFVDTVTFFTDPVAKWLYAFPDKPTWRIDDYPLLGAFMRQGDNPRYTKYISKFYDLANEANKLVGTVRYYKDTGQIDLAKEMIDNEKIRKKMRMAKSFNRVRRDLSDINKQIKKVWLDKDMTPDEKKKQIDKLTDLRNQKVRKVYNIYLNLK